MGFAVIMFVVLLAAALVTATVVMYGVAKDSQTAPLKAENIYAEREAGKVQTDMVVVTTKINGTAKYTSVDKDPNLLNLHLTIKNNGSIVLDPRKYSVILNRSWVWINSTSNNVTAPLTNSSTASLNLAVTPPDKPMQSLSLLVTAENGVKVITPTSPGITESNYSVDLNQSEPEKNCWYDLNLSWSPSYGEMWPISYYTIYYTDDETTNASVDKNNAEIVTTTSPTTYYFIGRAFRRTSV